jgi:hypothetical protein
MASSILLKQHLALRCALLPYTQFPHRQKKFESPLVVPPINDVDTFLAGLRFEKRNLLAELPSDLLEDRLS